MKQVKVKQDQTQMIKCKIMKFMKNIYLIVVSVLSITSSIAQEKSWDLQECVDYAL